MHDIVLIEILYHYYFGRELKAEWNTLIQNLKSDY